MVKFANRDGRRKMKQEAAKRYRALKKVRIEHERRAAKVGRKKPTIRREPDYQQTATLERPPASD